MISEDSTNKPFWEILVPYADNLGRKFSMDHHYMWDHFVLKLTDGLTILKTAKGKWISPKGDKYYEKMIICRINCTEEQIEKIAEFTINHYNQAAVLYYEISNKVFLKFKK